MCSCNKRYIAYILRSNGREIKLATTTTTCGGLCRRSTWRLLALQLLRCSSSESEPAAAAAVYLARAVCQCAGAPGTTVLFITTR
ncbi:jg27060 [Pararge aegeria aegeria]|uniref:Jg27060 protein n=1 Tax=Pararge aegeria aegeria TaxID=348720 RepID=A0A8S4S6G5_9NEOP|nr:jg27060 [Pararge aegeria aegeria]